jgi:anti-sigma B factor antagonist
MPFDVSCVRATQLTTVIVLQGEVDLHTAPRFRDALAAAIAEGARALVIDLGAVSFIDSTGLGVIVWAARELGRVSVAIVLSQRGLVRIFRICGLDRLLEIHETRDQALRGLRV